MKKFELIRTEVKRVAEQQRPLKLQRKTKTFKGKREVEAPRAAWLVKDNKTYLMHLYHAYAKMRGIELEAPKKKGLSADMVRKLMEKFAPKVETV
jgi:DNA-binding phage protein